MYLFDRFLLNDFKLFVQLSSSRTIFDSFFSLLSNHFVNFDLVVWSIFGNKLSSFSIVVFSLLLFENFDKFILSSLIVSSSLSVVDVLLLLVKLPDELSEIWIVL